uniref:Transporter n=1 Tax=Desulfobacca acetoxidans TaxID=60893 RepID=A0A7C5ALB2_9BACT
MRKMLAGLLGIVLLFFTQFSAWAQEPGVPTVGEERQEEKRKAAMATRVAEVERGGALLPAGRLVIEPSFEYDHISGTNVAISGFTIFEAILIGQVSVQRLRRDIFIPALTIRAGLKHAELYLRIPWLFRSDSLVYPVSGGAASNITQRNFGDNGLGDITSYLYYHLITEGKWRSWVPDTVIRLGLNFPSGKDPYSVKRRLVPSLGSIIPVEFPTGTGHWGLAVGSTFVKTVDPAVVFLNLGYYINFGRHVGTAGDPPQNFGYIKLGNTFEYSVGVILALQEKLSLNFAFQQRVSGATYQNGRFLPDTQINAISFNIGATYVIPPRMAVDFVVGIGLSKDAPDVTVLIRTPIMFEFGRKR